MTDTWGAGQGAQSPWGRASGPRAGFWRRFAAYIIDAIIVGIVNEIIERLIHGAAGFLIPLVLGISYYVFFEGGPKGATFGKQAMGIRVIDIHTGAPIGYPRAFIRWVGQIISSIPIFLGLLWMLWDRESQTWADKMARDVVVPTADYPPQSNAWT